MTRPPSPSWPAETLAIWSFYLAVLLILVVVFSVAPPPMALVTVVACAPATVRRAER